jgi:CheY-like chemotaxis protein
MDIQMPVLDGYQASKKIKQINENQIIIAVTSFPVEVVE